MNPQQPSKGNGKHHRECENDAYGTIMINVTQDIQSMTTFKRNSAGLMKRMRKTGRPVVLTVKGRAEVVVMDAGAYQQMAERVDSIEGIRRGLAQARQGLGRSADDIFDDFERHA